MVNLNTLAAKSLRNKANASLVPGLPRVLLSDAARRNVGVRNPNLGATSTSLAAKALPFADVTGQPSMRVQMRGITGGVETSLRRVSRYAENISDRDLEKLRRLLQQVARDAESLSHGPLSYSDLRRANHPYGRGGTAPDGRRRRGIGRLTARRGISNWAVINSHSGHLARSWSSELSRGKGGVILRLINSADYSRYLALGTRKMKAHGAFTTAMARHLVAINQEWSRLARLGWQREQAIASLTANAQGQIASSVSSAKGGAR